MDDKEREQLMIKRLIELDNENKQLKQDLTVSKSLLKTRDEILSEFEQENTKLKMNSSTDSTLTAKNKELEAHVCRLRNELHSKSNELADSNMNEEKLIKKIDSLESQLEEMKSLLPTAPVDVTVRDDSAKLEEELTRMSIEREEIMSELKKALARVHTLDRELSEMRDHVEGVETDAAASRASLKECREALCALEAQADAARNNVTHASRGNSMFSEFVDERVRLEADMRTLHRREQHLRRENRQLQEDLEQARLRSTRFREVRMPCRCGELEVALIETRRDRETAQLKLDQVQRLAMQLSSDLSSDRHHRALLADCRLELQSVKATLARLRPQNDELFDRATRGEAEAKRARISEKNAKEERADAVSHLDTVRERVRREEEARARAAAGLPPIKDDEDDNLPPPRIPGFPGPQPYAPAHKTPAPTTATSWLTASTPTHTGRPSVAGFKTPLPGAAAGSAFRNPMLNNESFDFVSGEEAEKKIASLAASAVVRPSWLDDPKVEEKRPPRRGMVKVPTRQAPEYEAPPVFMLVSKKEKKATFSLQQTPVKRPDENEKENSSPPAPAVTPGGAAPSFIPPALPANGKEDM